MVRLAEPFDPRVFECMLFAESDREEAARLLVIAAEYLRERKQMPAMLADYIADAFISAAAKSPELRAKQLSDDLNLTANNRRKVKAHWLDAWSVIRANPTFTKNAAALELKKQKKIGKTAADALVSKAWPYIHSETQ